MIRILSGQFRSREVLAPKGPVTRPTSSQLRACVFNICQQEVEDARFLDICAGSGAMGFEALSRGAKSAAFIESDRNAQLAINENIKRFDVAEQTELYYGDAIHALEKLTSTYDLCYFDPPYTTQKGEVAALTTAVLLLLDQKETLLSEHATLFIEESIYADLSTIPLTTLTLKSARRFGSSQLFCFIRSVKNQ